MDVITITLVGWVLAIANLIFVYVTIRSQSLSNSAILVASFEQQFESDEMIQSRNKIALTIQEELRSPKDTRMLMGYWPVLSFYDGIGAMVRRKAIDRELVLNRFGWRIVRCYYALTRETRLLNKTRDVSEEPNLYEHFEWLGKEMEKRYIKEMKRYKSARKQLDSGKFTAEYVTQEIALTEEDIGTNIQFSPRQGETSEEAMKKQNL